MKTKAVRMYGAKDIRLEEFDLPELGDDEILARVVSDSLCMSTYKAVIQGAAHKRVPKDIEKHPIITGHEFAGEIVAVGSKWQPKYRSGSRFSIQPNINHKGLGYAPGYSFEYFGGDATYIIIPAEVMENGFLLDYTGKAFFMASLAEPMSCIIAAFHESYHHSEQRHAHNMGTIAGGSMAILAGAGPMGLGTIDYAINHARKPRLLVVADRDEARLARARQIFPEEDAAAKGVELVFVNNLKLNDPMKDLKTLNRGKGYDDVFVFAPVTPVVELGDSILGQDGCLNFFAGPADSSFSAQMNFYNVHYAAAHVTGTSGGDTEDMAEALEMMGSGIINPAVMLTHIGGLDSAAESTLHLPSIPGGKKLIYTGIRMKLTAIDMFSSLGESDSLFVALEEITSRHRGLWSAEAESYLLMHAPGI